MMWRDLFNLKGGAASIQEINQRILADATVSGTNLIVLVMAIMIACVGLNMNSVAVIIGAMLISPLMGGIVAIGYGMATYDVHFIRQSMIKLAFQVGFAILTASLYFAISPLAYSTDELLARTSPTIWDVIVALCGGIAGAVGNTRQEKSNVIPGVAIATALMPPLCTAGYGLASGHYPFFLGAMYLFFINAFFIALAAFLVFKVLGVPSHGDVAASQFQRQRIILAALGILITAPSIYLAYQMVEENLRDMQVKSFISEDMDFQTTSVVSYTVKDHVLTVDLVGTLLTEKEIDALQDELHARNRLQDLELVVIQGAARTRPRASPEPHQCAAREAEYFRKGSLLQEPLRAVLPGLQARERRPADHRAPHPAGPPSLPRGPVHPGRYIDIRNAPEGSAKNGEQSGPQALHGRSHRQRAAPPRRSRPLAEVDCRTGRYACPHDRPDCRSSQ